MDHHVDVSQILTPDEVQLVISRNEQRARRYPHTAQNLVIFRLAVGAGLRASEIAGLELRDLHVASDPPVIVIRREIAKRHKARRVPLLWSQATLGALRAWKAARLAAGAAERDPVVCVLTRQRINHALGTGSAAHSRPGGALSRQQVWAKFRAVLRDLPTERQAELHTHSGRHTFATYALRAGNPLAAVQAALGHSSIAITAVYAHAVAADYARAGELYGEASETDQKPTAKEA